MRVEMAARAYPLLTESKAGSTFLFYRASLSENRFTLFRTHARSRAAEDRGFESAGASRFRWRAVRPSGGLEEAGIEFLDDNGLRLKK
jgi:hypothetical protein